MKKILAILMIVSIVISSVVYADGINVNETISEEVIENLNENTNSDVEEIIENEPENDKLVENETTLIDATESNEIEERNIENNLSEENEESEESEESEEEVNVTQVIEEDYDAETTIEIETSEDNEEVETTAEIKLIENTEATDITEETEVKESGEKEEIEKIEEKEEIEERKGIEEIEETKKTEEAKETEETKETKETEETKGTKNIATLSTISDEKFGTADETELDRAKWESVQDIKDISYFDFVKNETLTMDENFDNWISECQTYLDSEDTYNVDGFLHNTKMREFFMYEYNGELIKKTAVRLTKELLGQLKNAASTDACTSLTNEESQYKNDIHTLYTEGNNAYMEDWRNENSMKQDVDYLETLKNRGFAVNEIDGSSNVIEPSRIVQKYDWASGGMIDTESNAISTHISKDDFENIVNTGSFTINSDIAKIKFSEQSLKNIIDSDKFNKTSNYNGAESLYINISVLRKDYVDGNEELNEKQSRLVRALDKNIIDLVVKNARGEKINLQNGEIEVSIPFELDNNDKNYTTIWYINSDGKLEYHKATYKDGFVTFKTTHFSPYFQYKGVKKGKTVWDE